MVKAGFFTNIHAEAEIDLVVQTSPWENSVMYPSANSSTGSHGLRFELSADGMYIRASRRLNDARRNVSAVPHSNRLSNSPVSLRLRPSLSFFLLLSLSLSLSLSRLTMLYLSGSLSLDCSLSHRD